MFDRKMTAALGASVLQDQHGLNISSARDFINDYRHMLQGNVFQRAMSAPAIDYFLARIAADRGTGGLEQAIKAVYKHINYYEGIRKARLRAMRAVVARHEAHLTAPILLAEQESESDASVKKSLADSAAKRQARLEGAAKMPVKVRAVTEIYLRNADVVAEVLDRALIKETNMHHLSEAQWIAIAAHRLQHRWRSINPGQLDDLAADLWQDEQLRVLEPAKAVDTWLAPIWTADGPARPH